MKLLLLCLSFILVNNFVLSQFLGICPFLGVSDKLEKAVGMSLAVTFVMALASLATWLIYYCVLKPLGVTYLYTLSFILVIAVLVQLVEMFLQKVIPSLHSALGVYLPLITTNCAVLGVTVININNGYSLIESVLVGTSGALGFGLSIVLFAAIRQRLELSNIPRWLHGFPIALLTAGLMAIAFLGFKDLIPL